MTRRGWLAAGLLLLTIGGTAPVAAAPEGELTWAVLNGIGRGWTSRASA